MQAGQRTRARSERLERELTILQLQLRTALAAEHGLQPSACRKASSLLRTAKDLMPTLHRCLPLLISAALPLRSQCAPAACRSPWLQAGRLTTPLLLVGSALGSTQGVHVRACVSACVFADCMHSVLVLLT